MKKILITGMSGTGKTTVIEALQQRGHEAIDTDSDLWCEWIVAAPSQPDWVWREDKMAALLAQERTTPLFVSGCKSNQGKFYPMFDHVVLFSAATQVILNRIANRVNNPYGKTEQERNLILEHIEYIEPLLRLRCDLEIDTSTANIKQVVDKILKLAEVEIY
jgi:broad-specificity NMP kinase